MELTPVPSPTTAPKPLAPGVAEILAAQAQPTAIDAVPAPAAEAPRFIGTATRSTVMTLDWPVAYGGVEYREVVLRRLTVDEVSRFVKRVQNQPEDATIVFPVFRHASDDSEIPEAVLNALDDDDSTRLNEAAVAFLPRRFRGDPASTSIPAIGATSAP